MSNGHTKTRSRFVSALLPRHYFERNDPFSVFLHTNFTPFKGLLCIVLELAFLLLLQLSPRIWPNLGTMETESALSVSFLVTDDRHLGPLRRREIDMRNPQVVRLESFIPVTWPRLTRSSLELAGNGILASLIRTLSHPNLVWEKCWHRMNQDWHSSWPIVMDVYMAHIQAYWLLGLLTGEREHPSDETMLASIAAEKASTWGRCPSCPIRGASIEAFIEHYHDILFRERGIHPKVYGGMVAPILNFFSPLMPETTEES